MRKLGPRLDSKVSDRWEKAIYVVISKAGELPVYTVQDEAGVGPKRTLHRNYLLPVGMLDSEVCHVKKQDRPKSKTVHEKK